MDKLIERFIAIHENKGPEWEEIDRIPIEITVDEIIQAGVKPKEEWDYLFYEPYELTREQAIAIGKHLKKRIDYDFEKQFYVLLCLES